MTSRNEALVVVIKGSMIVWRLGGFGYILDAEYGFSKKISAACGFSVATRLRKME